MKPLASSLLLACLLGACSEDPPCERGWLSQPWEAPPLDVMVPVGAHVCMPTHGDNRVKYWLQNTSVHDANMQTVDAAQGSGWSRTSDNWYGSVDTGDSPKWSELRGPTGELRIDIRQAAGGAFVELTFREPQGAAAALAPPPSRPIPAAGAPEAAAANPTLGAPLDVPEHSGRRGSATPTTVVQAFIDYESPFDARFLPTLDRLIAEHPEVQVVIRNNPLPFHRNAMSAAQAALAVRAQVGDEGFWQYQAILFENARALGRPELERYAAQIPGLDVARFARELDGGTHEPAVRADMAAAAAAGARGTPTSFVGTTMIRGAQPYAAVEAALGGG